MVIEAYSGVRRHPASGSANVRTILEQIAKLKRELNDPRTTNLKKMEIRAQIEMLERELVNSTGYNSDGKKVENNIFRNDIFGINSNKTESVSQSIRDDVDKIIPEEKFKVTKPIRGIEDLTPEQLKQIKKFEKSLNPGSGIIGNEKSSNK